MSKWFITNAATDATPPTISILNDIGMWGVNAAQFLTEARAISKDSTELVVEINTRGGNVIDALAIYSGLRAMGKTIHTKVLGCAASAGSYVFMAGDKRSMPENSFLMVHSVQANAHGTADEHRLLAETMDKFQNVMEAAYVTDKLDRAGVAELMTKDTFLSAAECLSNGLATATTKGFPVTANFSTDDMPANVRAAFLSAASAAPVEPVAVAPVEPVAALLLTETVAKVIKDAGFTNMLAKWLPRIDGVEQANTVIQNANEVRELLTLVGQGALESEFLTNMTSLADVKKKLITLDPVTNIDTSIDLNPTNSARASGTVSHSDIWAARNKQLSGIK